MIEPVEISEAAAYRCVAQVAQASAPGARRHRTDHEPDQLPRGRRTVAVSRAWTSESCSARGSGGVLPEPVAEPQHPQPGAVDDRGELVVFLAAATSGPVVPWPARAAPMAAMNLASVCIWRLGSDLSCRSGRLGALASRTCTLGSPFSSLRARTCAGPGTPAFTTGLACQWM